MVEKELHLFIIWERARYKESDIINDIKVNFTILKCYDVQWNSKNIASNFTRFYGTNLPTGSSKEVECGIGNFLLIVVFDENPRYANRHTSKGDAIVNINMFDAKSKYRSWTGGGHKIHATNTMQETEHDLTLLLGYNVNDFLNNFQKSRDDTIEYLQKDIVGAEGWQSLSDLFYVLNNTVNYVILRGRNELLHNNFTEEHRDVDLLVEDYANVKYIINGISCCKKARPHEKVTINGYDYFLDLWSVQKRYFDPIWCQEMLCSKELVGGYYFLNSENELYALLYHCLIYKNRIADDYKRRISEIQPQILLNEPNLYKLLVEFLNKKFYEIYFAPLDASLNVHTENVEIREYATRYGILIRRTDIDVDSKNYISKVYKKEISYVKKGTQYLIKNEYEYLKRLNGFNQFPQIIDYNSCGNEWYIEMSQVVGVSFDDFYSRIRNQRFSSLMTFIKQMFSILCILKENEILHRDVNPQNIMIDKNGRKCNVGLIDFGWAVDVHNKDNCITPIGLGTRNGFPYRPPKGYSDFYSMGIILEKYWGHWPYIKKISGSLKEILSEDYENVDVLNAKIEKVKKCIYNGHIGVTDIRRELGVYYRGFKSVVKRLFS